MGGETVGEVAPYALSEAMAPSAVPVQCEKSAQTPAAVAAVAVVAAVAAEPSASRAATDGGSKGPTS